MTRGAHLATLGDGRIATWGGQASGRTGAALDPATGAWRTFAHPAMSGTMVTVRGSLVASAELSPIVGTDGSLDRLHGVVLDVDSGRTIPFAREVAGSFRNSSVLHLDRSFLGYVATDALHLFALGSRTWRGVAQPFVTNEPSDITIHDVGAGQWLFEGTSRGTFVLEPSVGKFCSLPMPDELRVQAAVYVSPRFRVALGGAMMVDRSPRHAPTREEDPRAQIVRLR